MGLKQNKQRIPFWAYLLLVLVLFVITFYIIARFKMPIDGAGSKLENGKCVITAIRPGGPADIAGLQIGDIIRSVSSVPVTGKGHMELLEAHRSGDTVSYLVIRNDNELIKSVTFNSFWSQNPALYFALYLLILIVCTTSIYILYNKPFDLTTRLFFIFLQLLAIAQNFRFLFLDNSYAIFATIAFIFSFNLFGVVLLHFHLIFPQPVSFYKRIKAYLKVVYAIGIIFGIAVTVLFIRRNYGDSDGGFTVFHEYYRWSISWMGLILALALSVAIHQFMTAKNNLARKQLRLVLIGSAFGLVTPILFGIYPEFIWQIEREQHLLTLIEFIGGIGTYIMTSFLAIAIFRYRLWNIEPFIRRAMFYGIATIVTFLSYLALVYLVDLISVQKTRMIHFLILASSIFIFLLLKDIIQGLIDRFFYRESYDSAKVVIEFEEKLAGIYRINELIFEVVESLYQIFHFKSFAFTIKENALSYKPVHLFGIDHVTINKEFEVNHEVDELIHKSKIFSIEELREKPKILEASGGVLIVPLTAGDHPFGFFIIGPKISEKSYSLQDIRVLSLLARRVIALFHTASLYQKGLDRQLMLESERTRIARDIHDDLGASLTRISILSEIAKEQAPESGNVNVQLHQISEICREVTQEMNQIIWALNSKNETIEGLITYIRRYALEYLEITPVKCVFNLPEKLPGLDLSVEARRNIYLSIREAMHNVVKHASAKKVEISLKINEHDFVIRIKDDGSGFDHAKLDSPGNGLINMRKRMNSIGGKLLVTSDPGAGTEISLFVPLGATMNTFVYT
ncbi:MAG: histidine kinase [Bacteroidota bacterium]|nr:histidine kinase [Bacteroidota bacterium]